MASRPNQSTTKAVRLGRSAVTGQFVLKPIGKPSKPRGDAQRRYAEFTTTEQSILVLAARRKSIREISDDLEVGIPIVKRVLETAKKQYGATTRVAAARMFMKNKGLFRELDRHIA